MTRDEAQRKVEHAAHLLDREIRKQPDPLLAMVPREQKVVFLATLRDIAQRLAEGKIPPRPKRETGLAREVIDTWPFTALSEAIVTADRAWRDVEED